MSYRRNGGMLRKRFFCFILKSKSPISSKGMETMTTLILFVYVCAAYVVLF